MSPERYEAVGQSERQTRVKAWETVGGKDLMNLVNIFLKSFFESLDGIRVEVNGWVLGVPIDHLIGESILRVDRVVILLCPWDTRRLRLVYKR
jgi:hypothetical protein